MGDNRRGGYVGSYFRPRASAVGGELDVAVVSAGPDDTGFDGRLGEGDDGAVVFSSGGFKSDGTAGGSVLRLIVSG